MDIGEALDILATQKSEMLDFTIKLSKINSGSYNYLGVDKVLSEIQAWVKNNLKCEMQKKSVPPLIDVNMSGVTENFKLGSLLRLSNRLDAKNKVLLIGHMDTVFEPEHSFQNVVELPNGKINGPGLTDMKGGIAVMLFALRMFEQLEISKKIGWEVILNPDEEIGSQGSVDYIMERAKLFDVGFGFEPSTTEEGALASDRKGSLNFTLVMRGISAHAGRNFFDGRNAIVELGKVLQEIDNLNTNENGTTINAGIIQGGSATNTVPDLCVCKLNARVQTEEGHHWFLKELDAIVEKFNDKNGFKLELHHNISKKPKIVSGNAKMESLYSMVQNVGAKLGQKLDMVPTGGCCDGNNLAAAGLINVDTMGVRGGLIHSDAEYLVVDSLTERAELLLSVLVEFAKSGIKDGTKI